MTWTRRDAAFSWAGSWRDIDVRDTARADWQRVWAYRRAGSYDRAFTVDGEGHTLPDRVDAAFARAGEASVALLIDGPHLAFGCHIFTPDEIALDVDPPPSTASSGVTAGSRSCERWRTCCVRRLS